MGRFVSRFVVLLTVTGYFHQLPLPLQADWPEFRGPTGQGIVQSEIPVRWSTEQNLAWRCSLPGEGWSSPVVAGDRIYLTAAIPRSDEGYQLVLLIVDARTGMLEGQIELFEQSEGAPPIHKKNSHASPTPIIDGAHIYMHFGHQGTACCLLDGTVVWRNSDLDYPPVHGNGGSPAVVGGLLVFSRDGSNISQINALDKSNGRLIWSRERNVPAAKRFSFCTPLVIQQGGHEQLIIPGSNVVQSLHPKTGEEIWRVRYEGFSVVPRPIYHAGLVFISTGFEQAKLLAIDPSGNGDVTQTHVRWTADSAIPRTPSLNGWKSNVLMISDNGIATCLEAASGKMLWKFRIGGDFSSSPLLAGNHLYVISESGVCTVLEVDDHEPSIVSTCDLGERTLASPAVIENDLLIRTSQALYRFTHSVQTP